jgi:thiol-disulfide isomerase/thioredoxin
MLRILTGYFLFFSLYAVTVVAGGPGVTVVTGGPAASLRMSGEAAGTMATPGLKNGVWRAYLERQDGNNIVFNFEVKDSAGKKVLYIRNAGERLLVDDISGQGDSVIIRLPFYESQLRAVVTKDGNLEGVWMRHLVSDWQVVPFKAFYGVNYRWVAEKGKASVAGRWAAVFRSTHGSDTTFRVGEFKQQGDRVTGTFLDAGGDLRYLEGVVSGDSLKLSCFDGTHAYFFSAKVEGNRLVGGQQYSGPVAHETWTAVKDAHAKLEDQFAMTKWKKDMPFTFTFRDIDGNEVSLSEPRFKGKVVLVQIMGSWCPNCMDETRFLSGFYNEYHSKGVEIVGLAYERSTDFERSQNSLRSFQQRFQVKYPMLITGVAVGDPQRAEKTLPQLDKILNFPTTIFVNKKGQIEKIHTGFSGPGTGEHYTEQKQEFYDTVNGMLAK